MSTSHLVITVNQCFLQGHTHLQNLDLRRSIIIPPSVSQELTEGFATYMTHKFWLVPLAPTHVTFPNGDAIDVVLWLHHLFEAVACFRKNLGGNAEPTYKEFIRYFYNILMLVHNASRPSDPNNPYSHELKRDAARKLTQNFIIHVVSPAWDHYMEEQAELARLECQHQDEYAQIHQAAAVAQENFIQRKYYRHWLTQFRKQKVEREHKSQMFAIGQSLLATEAELARKRAATKIQSIVRMQSAKREADRLREAQIAA